MAQAVLGDDLLLHGLPGLLPVHHGERLLKLRRPALFQVPHRDGVSLLVRLVPDRALAFGLCLLALGRREEQEQEQEHLLHGAKRKCSSVAAECPAAGGSASAMAGVAFFLAWQTHEEYVAIRGTRS